MSCPARATSGVGLGLPPPLSYRVRVDGCILREESHQRLEPFVSLGQFNTDTHTSHTITHTHNMPNVPRPRPHSRRLAGRLTHRACRQTRPTSRGFAYGSIIRVSNHHPTYSEKQQARSKPLNIHKTHMILTTRVPRPLHRHHRHCLYRKSRQPTTHTHMCMHSYEHAVRFDKKYSPTNAFTQVLRLAHCWALVSRVMGGTYIGKKV